MPDPHRIEGELRQLYSKPQYSALFDHRNRFQLADPKYIDNRVTPQSLAKQVARSLFSNRSLLNPVHVEELRGEVDFYRAFDGISSERGTAMTLGVCWSSHSLVQRIWAATEKLPGAKQLAKRREMFMDFMRSVNFVHPTWNRMIHISRMHVPSGVPVVLVRGRGDWKAMLTNQSIRKSAYPAKPFDEFKNPRIESVDDVIYSLGMMPIPGEEQYIIPLFNDMWVCKIELNPKWPLA